MPSRYPFAALVGQEALKDALLWLAVDPKIGGVLITGTRGTAKSTAARALADLLPSIEVVKDDPINRAAVPGAAQTVTIPTPFVELPVGATEDRVIGSLDVSALLARSERRFEPGLLGRANRGVLYVDEVNLLPDHIVDVLLDAAAMGENVIERDGASFSHEARIMLVGSMNPEEGELRPQLHDRFGLCVAVANDADVERRAEITARRMQFEHHPEAFCASYDAQSQALQARIRAARELLSRVTLERACLQHAARLAIQARVEGMRADLTIVRAARAIAALDRRSAVTIEDIERAAEPALTHRRRDVPPEPPSLPRPPRGEKPKPDAGGTNGSASPVAAQRPVVFDMGALLDPQLELDGLPPNPRSAPQASPARGRSNADVASGIAYATPKPGGRIAALSTIRAAALDGAGSNADGALRIEEHHLRFVRRRGRQRQLVIFVVDASGSMAAAARMSAAKGVVCGLLEDAYHRRDAVALIAFHGDGAEVIVPPTRSAIVAYRRLRTMATGGRTPLAHGLRLAAETAASFARRELAARAQLVVVSDARANVPQHGAFDQALRQAAALRASRIRALCIDTEVGRIRLGNAARLANALGAAYRHITECNDRVLGAAVREWMAIA